MLPTFPVREPACVPADGVQSHPEQETVAVDAAELSLKEESRRRDGEVTDPVPDTLAQSMEKESSLQQGRNDES